MTSIATNAFEQDGFAIRSGILDNDECSKLIHALQDYELLNHANAKQSVYALRNLLHKIEEVRLLAQSERIRNLVAPYLGDQYFAVRAMYFDKIEGANWKVPWHQDLVVAVTRQHDVEGFGPWSNKEGVVHAQAPAWLLEQMVAVRVHLDDCDTENGPLRVLPGTQRYGKLTSEQLDDLRSKSAEHVCTVEAGGVILMRPLLLHASSSAQSPGHRRVIHIEYSNAMLPEGLEWHETVKANS